MTGKMAEHLLLVNAILITGMSYFNYLKITRELEKPTMQLSKSNSKPQFKVVMSFTHLCAKVTTDVPVIFSKFL